MLTPSPSIEVKSLIMHILQNTWQHYPHYYLLLSLPIFTVFTSMRWSLFFFPSFLIQHHKSGMDNLKLDYISLSTALKEKMFASVAYRWEKYKMGFLHYSVKGFSWKRKTPTQTEFHPCSLQAQKLLHRKPLPHQQPSLLYYSSLAA